MVVSQKVSTSFSVCYGRVRSHLLQNVHSSGDVLLNGNKLV